MYRNNNKLAFRDNQLKEQIIQVLAANPSYGHRRIALALGIGRKRARRAMRLFGIRPYKRKARWTKRNTAQTKVKYRNLVKASSPIKPGLVYASDFTYIRHQGKYLYLATIIDLFTREIVGWNLSNRHNKELILGALLDAVKNTGLKLPKVIHSDQGSEYCSQQYTSFLDWLGIKISMSKKRSPWENAFQESFYNNFKTDLGLEIDRFNTLGKLIEAIHQTISCCNNRRIHLTLKMPPNQFRQQYYQQHQNS